MMQTTNAAQGAADIAGNVARLKEDYVAIDPKMDAAAFHLKTIGRLIEQNEGEIRSEMHGIFINKTKQIINTGRLRDEYVDPRHRGALQAELMATMQKTATN